VALTHTDIDHLSGLVDKDAGLMFPNADRVYVATEELMAFREEPRMIPVLPRLMPLEQGDGPLPGVVAVNAPGHSPGHMAFLVEGRLMIWGDLVHHPLQFQRPDVAWKYDENPEEARATRAALLESVVEEGWIVAGSHLPDPGIGRIERDGAAYRSLLGEVCPVLVVPNALPLGTSRQEAAAVAAEGLPGAAAPSPAFSVALQGPG